MRTTAEDTDTRHTLTFAMRHLKGTQGRRILEVGCGDGALAVELMQAGFEVIAIDSSTDSVAAAHGRGVDARHDVWPSFSGRESGFDAILFTRSLHHIHALENAVALADELLDSSGLVIVEDFDHSGVDESHMRWFHSVLQLVHHAGYEFCAASLCAELVNMGVGLDIWRRQHDHDLHNATAMQIALEARFALVETAHCAYLYRYLLEEADRPVEPGIAAHVLALEESMGLLDDRWLIGRRIVARKCTA